MMTNTLRIAYFKLSHWFLLAMSPETIFQLSFGDMTVTVSNKNNAYGVI
jgi:hypothetical protein